MQTSPSAGIRQLESLLQEKLIPWAEKGAPLIWLGTPPRSALPLDIREEAKPSLPPLRARDDVQKAKRWKDAHVNSVEVPVLGCVYEGKVDYIVHTAPGEPGRQWTVPIESGAFQSHRSGGWKSTFGEYTNVRCGNEIWRDALVLFAITINNELPPIAV
jgi:hypothetical protein